MAELSPFLNSNPMDRAYALGTVGRNLTFLQGTRVELVLSINGGAIWTTGLVREETLKSVSASHTFYRRKKDRVRLMLHKVRYVNGYPYTASFPVQVNMSPPNGKGQVTVQLNGQFVQSSPAGRKARGWASGLAKPYRGLKLKVPRSSDPRPAQEVLSRPFLKTEQFGDPSSYTTNQSIVTDAVYSRTWTGTRTPGWGRLKPRAFVDNPHSVGIVDVSMNKWSWYQTRPANGAFHLINTTFLDRSQLPARPTVHLELAEFNALKKLIARAGQGIQANLAQNIAQVSQLSALIVRNTTAMIQAVRFLRRGNIPAAVSQLQAGRLDPRWKGGKGNPSVKKTLANNWLELQYGWKPLLSDIEGFIKIMGQQQGPNDFVQRVRSTASASRQYIVNEPDTTAIVGKNAGKTTFTFQTSCKFVVRFRVDNPLLNLFAQTGFTNPINLAWEILPFSFVFDWFLPVGSYLESLRAWDGVTFLGGTKTHFTKMKRDTTIAYSGPHPADSGVNVQHYANYHADVINLNRMVIADFPSQVMPSFNIRGIEGGNRAANAIALLGKALK